MAHTRGRRASELAIPAALIALALGAVLYDWSHPAPARTGVAPPLPVETPAVAFVAGLDGVTYDARDPMESPEVREYDRLSGDFLACFRGGTDQLLTDLAFRVGMERAAGLGTSGKTMLRDVPAAVEVMRRKTGRSDARLSARTFFEVYGGIRPGASSQSAAIDEAVARAWER